MCERFLSSGNSPVSDAAELKQPRFLLFTETKIICGGLSVNSDHNNDDDDDYEIPSQQREKEETAETQNDTIRFLVPLIRTSPK